MPRNQLIRRLAELAPVTPASCFVLLWTYFRHDKVGLSSVENRIRVGWGHVLKLPARDLSGGPVGETIRSALDELSQ